MTKADYTANLEYLKSQHPLNVMIDTISRAYNKVNCMYLAAEIADLSNTDKSNTVKTETVQKDDYSADPSHKKICRNLTTLYGSRARLSNLLHDCETDEQRSNLSQEIQSLQSKITEQRRAKDFYEIHKRPIDPEMTHYEIPSDPVELIKKRNSLRSAISRHKSQIDQAQAKNHIKKVDQINTKLIQKQTHLSYVEQAINKKDI